MPLTIVFLGKEEKNFQYILSAFSDGAYHFDFVQLEQLESASSRLREANLIILDTLPYPERQFGRFYALRQDARLATTPVLALVKDTPPRLRYRLVNMGITDYLAVPFDRLDLQVRVRNILASNHRPASPESASPGQASAVKALQILKTMHREMDNSILNLDRDEFLNKVLAALRELCNAHFAMLFEPGEEDELILSHVQPGDELLQPGLRLGISDTPILLKALRAGEPTFLSSISPDNPFVTLVNSFFNLKAQSVIVCPIQVQNPLEAPGAPGGQAPPGLTPAGSALPGFAAAGPAPGEQLPRGQTPRGQAIRSVLCILKTDREKLTEYHYLLVQNFARLLIHSYQISSLQQEMKERLNNRAWQFYFEFLEQVLDQISFGILVVGQGRRIAYLNANAAALLSVAAPEALHRPLGEILGEETADTILRAGRETVAGGERPEFELPTAEGKPKLVGFSVQEFTDKRSQEQGYIISLKDITSNKEIQEEMRRVDRLASLGVLVSGIAHEIRNPLAGIKAMVQTFQDELAEDDPKNEYVERIIRLVNRLDKLLRTLFSYAKPSKPNRQYCSIETILTDVVSLVRQKLRQNNIKLAERLHPELPKVFIDPSQIQQVLVNLLLNSIEAIDKGGEISISIYPFDPATVNGGRNRLSRLASGNGEQYVEIKIRDNGCGISPENLKHIFNPFFTTKPFGTGLGLSIVYQIIKENAGQIYYESKEGEGTTCYLYLPAQRISQLQMQEAGE